MKKNLKTGLSHSATPSYYFDSPSIAKELENLGLTEGQNAFVFYETRADWKAYNPEKNGWKPAQQRQAPLEGEYVARVPATTASDEGERYPIPGIYNIKSKGRGH